jgi:hypothetical protein
MPARTIQKSASKKTGRRTAQRPSQMPDTSTFRECIEACNATFAYCIEQGGDHVRPEHLKALMDCLEVCITTSDLVGRSSPLAGSMMEVCAEACKACEESCEEFAGDPTMERCADACRECYEHCSG